MLDILAIYFPIQYCGKQRKSLCFYKTGKSSRVISTGLTYVVSFLFFLSFHGKHNQTSLLEGLPELWSLKQTGLSCVSPAGSPFWKAGLHAPWHADKPQEPPLRLTWEAGGLVHWFLPQWSCSCPSGQLSKQHVGSTNGQLPLSRNTAASQGDQNNLSQS